MQLHLGENGLDSYEFVYFINFVSCTLIKSFIKNNIILYSKY